MYNIICETNLQSRFGAAYRMLGAVHWDDPEGWYREGGSHANRVKLTRHSRYQAMWCDFRDTRRDLCLNILLLASNAWILLRYKDFRSMMNVRAERVSISIRRDFTLPNLG